MKTFRVLEYKYTGKPLNWIIANSTKLFNWNTGSYSHCEIWLPDEEGNFTVPYVGDSRTVTGQCFTSTMRGSVNGSVIRPACEVIKHPERWDFFEIEVEDHMYNHAISHALSAVKNNKGYDKPLIVSFFFPYRFASKGKDICSEVCMHFLNDSFVLDTTGKRVPSPRRLARWLINIGHEPKSLRS